LGAANTFEELFGALNAAPHQIDAITFAVLGRVLRRVRNVSELSEDVLVWLVQTEDLCARARHTFRGSFESISSVRSEILYAGRGATFRRTQELHRCFGNTLQSLCEESFNEIAILFALLDELHYLIVTVQVNFRESFQEPIFDGQ
jgi:hypothetical protein